jgi:hypothetical protein
MKNVHYERPFAKQIARRPTASTASHLRAASAEALYQRIVAHIEKWHTAEISLSNLLLELRYSVEAWPGTDKWTRGRWERALDDLASDGRIALMSVRGEVHVVVPALLDVELSPGEELSRRVEKPSRSGE